MTLSKEEMQERIDSILWFGYQSLGFCNNLLKKAKGDEERANQLILEEYRDWKQRGFK